MLERGDDWPAETEWQTSFGATCLMRWLACKFLYIYCDLQVHRTTLHLPVCSMPRRDRCSAGQRTGLSFLS